MNEQQNIIFEKNMYALINSVLKNIRFEECPLEMKKYIVELSREMFKAGYNAGMNTAINELNNELMKVKNVENKN